MNANKLIVAGIVSLLALLLVLGLSLSSSRPKPSPPAAGASAAGSFAAGASAGLPAVVDQNLLYLAHAGMVLNREFDYVVRIATNEQGNFQLVWRPAMCSPTSEWQVHPMVMTNYGQAWSAKLVSQRDLLAKFLTNGFK